MKYSIRYTVCIIKFLTKYAEAFLALLFKPDRMTTLGVSTKVDQNKY